MLVPACPSAFILFLSGKYRSYSFVLFKFCMCGWFLCIYICALFVCRICIVKGGCWSSWNLSYRQLHVLGVVPGSLRAASAFVLWAIYPALPSICWCLVATVPERLWTCCCRSSRLPQNTGHGAEQCKEGHCMCKGLPQAAAS